MDVVRKPPKSRWWMKRVMWSLGVLILATSVIGVAWPREPGVRHVDGASVWKDKVKRGDLVRQILAQGTLVPEHVRWLSAESSALVKHIAVRPGEHVEADTVVVVLENAELELAALEAERAAATAQTNLIQLDVRTDIERRSHASQLLALRKTVQEAERRESLVDRMQPEGLVSTQEAGLARDNAANLRAQLASEGKTEAALEQGRQRQLAAQSNEKKRLEEIAAFRRRQLAALEVRAGISGVVQEIPLESGQWVAIGTTLAKVAKPELLKAELRVSQVDAASVHRGMKVHFESSVGSFEGRVERVDPAVVAGNVRVEVSLGGAMPDHARVDQPVTAHIEVETLHDVLYVARPSGVQPSSNAPLYRLREGSDTADRITARVGRASTKYIEIQAGLEEGDEVIVSDTSAWESAERVVLDQ